ncbi:hypothetical protein [Dyadobacter sp. CY323]|uniref:hypothetical protein n=1 Tax=Dyadobacter sp. CY323 TaxID=2907302 RepID=UPI001F46B0FA|nr:hypothetical protein [Dyadobacter sp. CY323]MCE6993053.1 hypothetical protein [Dyadobacter sp. CY323]
MSIYKKFSSDTDLESNAGITVDYGDFKITIKRAGGSNKAFGKLFNDKIKPYRLMMQAGNMDDAAALRILAECYAETVVIGWEGITDEKDKKIPFNRENCIKVLTDLPELFGMIQDEANRASNFRKAETEAEAKNSVKS